jgi:hypothetical protein
MILTNEEVQLLKLLKGAGERGRTIREFDTRNRLERLVRARYVADQSTGLDLVHYRITKLGEDALSDVSRF